MPAALLGPFGGGRIRDDVGSFSFHRGEFCPVSVATDGISL